MHICVDLVFSLVHSCYMSHCINLILYFKHALNRFPLESPKSASPFETKSLQEITYFDLGNFHVCFAYIYVYNMHVLLSFSEFEQMEVEYFIPPEDDAWQKVGL